MYISDSVLETVKREATEAITAANNIFTGFLRANVETIKLEEARPQLVSYLTPVIAFATKTPPSEVKQILSNTTVTKLPAGGYVIRIPDNPNLLRQRELFLLIRNTLLFGAAFWFLTNVLWTGKKAVFGDTKEDLGNYYNPLSSIKKYRIILTDAYGRRYTMKTSGYSKEEARYKALLRMIKRFGSNIVEKEIKIQEVH